MDYHIGTINTWNEERYFGFIKAIDGEEYFFHGSQAKTIESKLVGLCVVYQLGPSHKHPGKQEASALSCLTQVKDRKLLLSLVFQQGRSLSGPVLNTVTKHFGTLLSDDTETAGLLKELREAGAVPGGIPHNSSLETRIGLLKRCIIFIQKVLPAERALECIYQLFPAADESLRVKLYLTGITSLSKELYPVLARKWAELSAHETSQILNDVTSAGEFCGIWVQEYLVGAAKSDPYDAIDKLAELEETFPNQKKTIRKTLSESETSPLFDILCWINLEGNPPVFSESGAVVSGLTQTDQRLFLKKIFSAIDKQHPQVNFDMLFDFIWTDISTWVVLELLVLIRQEQAASRGVIEKAVYTHVIKHIQQPTDDVDVAGYFDECLGAAGCTLHDSEGEVLAEMPDDVEAQKKVTVSIRRYSRPEHSDPFWCEGRKSPTLHTKMKQPFWWCHNGACFEHSIPESGRDCYTDFTFWDFLRILKLEYPIDQYQMMLSVLNRVRKFLAHLKCRDCGEIMHPKDQSNYSFYRVSHFVCKNGNCTNEDVVYLSHCLNWLCHEVIDSRDTSKCKPEGMKQEVYGWYVCRACYACCNTEKLKQRADNIARLGKKYNGPTVGHKDRGEICCPDCGSILDLETDKYAMKVLAWLKDNEGNKDYIFRSGVNKLGKWYLMKKSGFPSVKECDRWRSGIEAHGFEVNEANSSAMFFVKPPPRSKIWKCDCGHQLNLGAIASERDYERVRAIQNYHDCMQKDPGDGCDIDEFGDDVS